MGLSELFIRRPVATMLLAFGLFMTGVVAFVSLPVAPLPRIDFPTININARLPGADPVTMAATTAAPLERRLGEIAGVSELTSVSSQGNANITAQFDLDRDIEGAARDVQAALNASGADLPVDLPTPPTYRKVNPADAPILILAVTSSTLPPGKLYDACDSILNQRISQVEGVAQVTVSGADKPAVRVQVDPAALASTGLGMEDVRNRLQLANANQPKGSFEGDKQSVVVSTNDQLRFAKDYAPMVLKSGNGTTLRLSNIATVIDGTENSRQGGWFNNGKAVILIIQKQADANVIETVDRIKKILPQLESWMPAGTTISILTDRTQTIRASVNDVEVTLMISVFLVIMVVLLALGRVTPTLAVSITVPLSLSGTFAVMWLLGYTLDNISLMALTISVGFVVDDAIVMIENITRHVEEGESPLTAAIKGAKEITFTVISISVSLVAVFIPLLFMGGIIGRLFHEFAVTLTVAIAVSVLVSLTVTPTVYAHMMNYRRTHGRKTTSSNHWGERVFAWMQARYEHGMEWVIRYQGVMLMVMMSTIFLTLILYYYVPKGFFPQQDTGLIVGTTEGRIDISFQAMAKKQQEINRIVLQDPAVESLGSSTGSNSGSTSGNQGRIFIALKPLAQRDVSASELIDRLRPKLASLEGMNVFLRLPDGIPVGGRPGKAQFQFTLSDESLDELREWTPKLVNALKNEPGITDVSSDQDAAGQQVNVIVDRDAVARLGVDMSGVDEVLEDAFAQRQVSTIYTQRNQYHVVLEVSPQQQESPQSLENIFVKGTNDKQIRLSEIARFEMGTIPTSVMHQGQFPASTLTFNLPAGASLGDAAARIEQVAKDIGLPPTMHSGFAGNAKALGDSLHDEPILIGAAILSIYIVLGVLYESLAHPFTIISTLPSAGIGALISLMVAAKLSPAGGFDLNVISIIGVILLMGIVKKNGILLVDFAIVAEHEHGKDPEGSILEACSRRFRPIMMTTFAAVLGALPLVLAGGNGSELRRPLGVAVVGGLIVSQLLTLYTTPVMYLALDRFRTWFHTLDWVQKMLVLIFIVATCLLGFFAIAFWLWRKPARRIEGYAT